MASKVYNANMFTEHESQKKRKSVKRLRKTKKECDVSAGSVRRHSEPSSKSTVTKNTIDGRKSTENPPVKIPTPSTCSKPPAKPLTNGRKRRSNDTSTYFLQSGSVEESHNSLAKMQKKENSRRDTESSFEKAPVNGNAGMWRNYKIPKIKTREPDSDLRLIINRRRESKVSAETATKPSCSHQDGNSMEWPMRPKQVIDKCNEKMYGHLKKYAPESKPTVVNCISEVVRRWDIITGKKLDPATSVVIKQLITLAKKYNMGKEVFTNNDMKVYFKSCQTLVKQLGQQDDDTLFLTKLIAMSKEWEQSQPVSQ